MSNPLPLRLCCLAAMAPALTEAATQARVKLSTPGSAGPGGGPHNSPVLNGRVSPALDGRPGGIKPAGPQKPPASFVTLPKDLLSQSQRLADTALSTAAGKIGDSRPATSSPNDPLQHQTALSRNIQAISSKTQGLSSPINSIPKSVGGMSLPTKGDTNHMTGHSKMPRSGGLLLASATSAKANAMGFINKLGPQNNEHPNTPATAMLPPPAVAGPSGSLAGCDGIVETEEHLQIQDVGNSLTIQTVDSQNAGAGMSDVGVLTNVDLVAETTKRQKDLERKSDRLLRRLRRLQGRQAVSHIQKQLSGLVDHQHQNLQSMAKSMKVQPTNVDLKTELLQNEDVKSLSTAALVDLVMRLQSSQHSLSLRQRLANPSSPSTSGEVSSNNILKLDEDLCVEMNRVSSTLQTNLHHLENAIDSDATESSSGGESCDEDYDIDDEKLPRQKLQRRSEWKWPMERAAVAARWTWLQAQVSDLEYRIRQQTDIYRQIRAGKGAVVLGDAPSPPDLTQLKSARTGRKLTPLEEKIANLERKNTEMSPCNLSTLLSNVDKQSSRLTQQLGNVYSPQGSPLVANRIRTAAQASTPKTPTTPNGFVDATGVHPSTSCATPDTTKDTESLESKKARTDSLPGLHFDPPSPIVDNTCQAARSRPVRSYGKRKLLRTAGIQYMGNRKAARLSTVKCRCYPPMVPCAMCGGRYNNNVPLHPDTMPVSERAALLDHSYHQVLSFTQDMPLTVHFESLLKSGEWQHKPPPRPIKPMVTTDRKRTKLAAGAENNRRVRRQYNRKLSKSASAAILSSAKIRSKYEQNQLSRSHSGNLTSSPSDSKIYRSSSEMRKRKTAISAIESLTKRGRSSSVCNWSGQDKMIGDSNSPLSQSLNSKDLKELRRRRGESAFDINNIVIPYSMAASTRVEKLQYKEILTPKWREVSVDSDTTTQDTSVMSPTVEPSSAVTAAGEADSANSGKPNNDQSTTKLSVPNQSDTISTNNKVLNKENGLIESKTVAPSESEPPSIPGFKKIDDDCLHLLDKVLSSRQGSNGMVILNTASGQEVEVEDLSDVLIIERHNRCEVLEKKRFTSVVPKRTRASRSESKLSGLEPATPDAEAALSVLQTPPNTPASVSKGAGQQEEGEDMRRRSGSCSSRTDETPLGVREVRRRMSSMSRSRSQSIGEDRYKMEPEFYVESWSRREFPLTDDLYDSLFREPSSVTVQAVEPIVRRNSKEVYGTSTPDMSNPCSPHSSTSSEVIEEDDPNDPEWTVVQGSEKIQQKTPTIVLKLAKR